MNTSKGGFHWKLPHTALMTVLVLPFLFFCWTPGIVAYVVLSPLLVLAGVFFKDDSLTRVIFVVILLIGIIGLLLGWSWPMVLTGVGMSALTWLVRGVWRAVC